MKARTALHFASIRKWDTYGLGNPSEAERLFGIAAEAAKNCMDLNVYKLHDSFPELFLQSTKNSPEGIFVIPRSKAYSNGSLRQYLNGQSVTVKLTRTPVGTNALGELPSWDLLCSFLCRSTNRRFMIRASLLRIAIRGAVTRSSNSEPSIWDMNSIPGWT